MLVFWRIVSSDSSYTDCQLSVKKRNIKIIIVVWQPDRQKDDTLYDIFQLYIAFLISD